MNKSKSVFIATSKGLCVKVYLDLKNNYVKGMQKRSYSIFKKIGLEYRKTRKEKLS